MPAGKRKVNKSANKSSRNSEDGDNSTTSDRMNTMFHHVAVDGVPVHRPVHDAFASALPLPHPCGGVVRLVSSGGGAPLLPALAPAMGRASSAAAMVAAAAAAPPLVSTASLPLPLPSGAPPPSMVGPAVAPTAFLARFVTPPEEYTPVGAAGGATAPTQPTREPLPNDVVCGRGKGSYNCPGNRKFRAIVKKYMPAYTAARTKVDKSAVLQTVLTAFTTATRGRFVRWDKAGRQYVEIPVAEAREKVGHAMREALAAAELVEGKQEAQQVFQEKHQSLLERQRAIFEKMVGDNR